MHTDAMAEMLLLSLSKSKVQAESTSASRKNPKSMRVKILHSFDLTKFAWTAPIETFKIIN